MQISVRVDEIAQETVKIGENNTKEVLCFFLPFCGYSFYCNESDMIGEKEN
jgi:hypothetical protein